MTIDVNFVREALEAHIARQGQGAITQLAKQTRISRQHITRFRNGKTGMTPPYRERLYRAIIGKAVTMKDTTADKPHEELLHMAADELEMLVRQLRSSALSDRSKADKFFAGIRSLEMLAGDIRETLGEFEGDNP